MRVTAIQYASVVGNPAANRELLGTRLQLAAEQKPHLIVLPELAFTGLAWDVVEELAEPLLGPTVQMIAGIARSTGAYIVPGSLWERADDGSVYNTAVVVDPTGAVCAAYRKMYLFRPMGEHVSCKPGDTAVWFDMAGFGRIGMAICYDIRFPELFRALVRSGCTAFIVPAAFPAQRIEHWITLVRARAIENQAFVVAVNRSGADGDVRFGGCSLIVDPEGKVMASADTDEQVLTAVFDPAQVVDVRTNLPALEDMPQR